MHRNNTTAYTGKFSGSFETLQFLSCAHCAAQSPVTTMVACVIDNVVAHFYGEEAVHKCESVERKVVRKSCRNKSRGSKNSEEGARRRCQEETVLNTLNHTLAHDLQPEPLDLGVHEESEDDEPGL